MSWDYLNHTLRELGEFSIRFAWFLGSLLSAAGYVWYVFADFGKKIRRR